MPRKAKKVFQSPKGTQDILPKDQKYWDKIESVTRNIALHYGFGRIATPIFEDTDLYMTAVGLETDVVSKEMYSFKTKGKDNVTLRPEGTAGVVRAYIENGMSSLPQPVKLYYLGPMFRYEKPQTGRFRQHHQIGFEVLGDDDAVYDAQIISLFFRVCTSLGLKNLNVKLNSIGCKDCRKDYRKQLLRYYRSRIKGACANCKKRIKTNPLRVLDCKEEKCQPIKQNAPNLIDGLCRPCNNHFKSVLEFLDELDIPYSLNPHLVRGLDYYCKTVFEVFLEDEHIDKGGESKHKISELALGGGGRYDGLVKILGGKDMASVGASIGIERIIEAMKIQGVKVPDSSKAQVFLVQIGELGKKKGLKLFDELSKSGIYAYEAFGRGSISSQLRIADKVGAKISLIIGQKEAIDGDVILREMESGSQEIIPIENIIKTVKQRLKK